MLLAPVNSTLRIWAKKRVIIVGLAALCAACSESPSGPTPTIPAPHTPPAQFIRVTGRVIDLQTNAGVAAVTLNWSAVGEDSRSAGTARAVTDTAGNFTVSVPRAESYFVSSESPRVLATVRIPGKVYQTDFLVNNGTCAIRYGVVFDAITRLPIAGARVSLAGSTITEHDGTYHLNMGCRTGRYGIGTTAMGVSHPDYIGARTLDTRAENLTGSLRRVDFALTPR